MAMQNDYMITEEASVGYQKRTLIDHVNLHVKKGEILTLIGPNGVGKSTILKSIIRQLSLIAGTVSIDGKELSSYAPKELAKKMAIVMTERIHPERYTCYDVVATGRYPYTGKMGMLQKEDEEKIMKELEHPYVSGLSILGGEPLEYNNQKGILPLVKKVKERFPDKDIWCYTGYTFDRDVTGNMFNNWEETKELMSYIDVIVDGKFQEDKKDLNLKFRGSSNQRIIDVQKSLKVHKVIPYEI